MPLNLIEIIIFSTIQFTVLILVNIVQCSSRTTTIDKRPVPLKPNIYNRPSTTIKSAPAVLQIDQSRKAEKTNRSSKTLATTNPKTTNAINNACASKSRKIRSKSMNPKNMIPVPDSKKQKSKSSSHNRSYSSSSLNGYIVAHFESTAQKKELGIAEQVRQDVFLKSLALEDRARIKKYCDRKKNEDPERRRGSAQTDSTMQELDSDEEYFQKSIKISDVSKSRKHIGSSNI